MMISCERILPANWKVSLETYFQQNFALEEKSRKISLSLSRGKLSSLSLTHTQAILSYPIQRFSAFPSLLPIAMKVAWKERAFLLSQLSFQAFSKQSDDCLVWFPSSPVTHTHIYYYLQYAVYAILYTVYRERRVSYQVYVVGYDDIQRILNMKSARVHHTHTLGKNFTRYTCTVLRITLYSEIP